ncbi:MAG: extracellular solute-binding protein [Chloroflexota bacterium]
MTKLCDLYSQANPGIKAVVEEVVYAEIAMKTELGFATGDLQDSLFAFTRWHWLGAYKGWYLAIDDLLSAGLVPDYKDYYEIGVKNQMFEGKTYGLLDSVHGGANNVIVWNRKLFEDAGVPVPTKDMDLSDLADAARKVAKPDKGIFGIQMDMGTPARIQTIIRSWGKPQYGAQGDTSAWLFSADGKKYNFQDNPGAKAFFETWLAPLMKERVHPGPADQVQGGLFVAGLCAMYQGHHGHPFRFKSSVKTWEFHTQDAILLPVGPDKRRGTAWECHNRCVYAKTPNPQETLKLNTYLTSKDAAMEVLGITGNRSGRQSVYRDPRWAAEFPIYKDLDELLMAGTVEPYPMPWNLRDVECSDSWSNNAGPIYTGVEAFAKQAPTVQREMQKIVDLPRP